MLSAPARAVKKCCLFAELVAHGIYIYIRRVPGQGGVERLNVVWMEAIQFDQRPRTNTKSGSKTAVAPELKCQKDYFNRRGQLFMVLLLDADNGGERNKLLSIRRAIYVDAH